ncbi:LysR family transcriptional regulator [Bosea sp. (in: a-proteobacteria)]|uniref:LysR family transcriptional regulator n=1 Tax=Bosea sp. (in: a-proteobacteria) TaxID=1871050 RepID=UPI002626D991|nr:LysR family transcriptional regulator [Bosea sp. (in: a-proteobacteria)]MCO5089928.1 LysR family transcriptional regulator [Bosea sp. (in: a-proteobacteria)]
MASSSLHAIELRHLRYFIAAAEHGSFRKAGAAIGVQQSALSRRIRDLEYHLGATLFLRHSGGVSLTFAGQRFLRRARQVVRNVGDGMQDIASIGRSEHGRVRIGIYSSIASGFLAELLHRYADRHPKVQIDLIDDNPGEHIAAIRRLRLDTAFMTGERDWPDCTTLPLWSERVFAVLPNDHSLAQRDEVQWDQLADEEFIVNESAPGQEVHDYLVQRLAAFGHHPQIRVQRVGRENLLPLVALSRGLTVVSEAMTAAQFPDIVYRPIFGEILPFSAVWSPKNDNPALSKLLDLARSLATARQTELVTQSVSWMKPRAGPSQSPDPLQ